MTMLQHFYDDFMKSIPGLQPELFDENTMEKPLFYEDYVLLSFPVAAPIDLEEVMNRFEDEMQLTMLYHHVPFQKSAFGHSACAYSRLDLDLMFKVNAQTETDGKVHAINVTIYDSLELMNGDLCLDLHLHSMTGQFKYERDKKELMIEFL